MSMTRQNQNMGKKLNNFTDTFIVQVKSESVYEDLQEMLKENSTPQTMKPKDLYP